MSLLGQFKTYASLADRIIAYSIDAVLIFILISLTVYFLAENDIELHSTSISLLSLVLWTLADDYRLKLP